MAGKDPRKATPYQIEVYLEENKIFRNRVLAQFTNYRTEWRNPSTHDYNLDFDEDEAFLAIVSVSAFAKLLIDQIAERLSFVAVKQETKTFAAPPELNSTRTEKLLDRAIAILQEFARHYASNTAGVRLETEAQLIGAVSGFFSSLTPDTKIETDGAVGSKRTHRFDLALSEGDQRVIIEVKRSKSVHNVGDAIVQLAKLLEQAEVPDGILFLFSASTNNYSRRAVPVHGLGRARSVNILSPV